MNFKLSFASLMIAATTIPLSFEANAATAVHTAPVRRAKPGEGEHNTRGEQGESVTERSAARKTSVEAAGGAGEAVVSTPKSVVVSDFKSPGEWAKNSDVEVASKIFATISDAVKPGVADANGAEGFITAEERSILLSYLQKYVPAKGSSNATYTNLSKLLSSSNPQSKAFLGFVGELIQSMKTNESIKDGQITAKAAEKLDDLFQRKLPQEWSVEALKNAAAFVREHSTGLKDLSAQFDALSKSVSDSATSERLQNIREMEAGPAKTEAMQDVLYKADLIKMLEPQFTKDGKVDQKALAEAVKAICDCTGTCKA